MKTGAIYVRKSVQTGRGDSIQNQIELCKAYAKKRNILVDDSLIFSDEGYSGKDFNRPGFKRMLNELEHQKFDILICYKLDRISRSLNDFSNLNNILERYQTSFVSIKELFDTSTPMGKSMMYIASVFAQLERETIAERLTDNLSKLSRTGRWLGGITPTGFKSEVTTYFDDSDKLKKVYKLTPIDFELSKVVHLFDKFLELKSLSNLKNYCADNDLKSKNNISFSKTALKQILTNPVYCIADDNLYSYLYLNEFSISNKKNEFDGSSGALVYRINGEKIISLAKHKGVIESKKWIEAQDLISSNRKKSYRQGTSSVGLLSGLIKCSECGSLMRVKHGHKNVDGISYYYVCTLKEKNKTKCNISNLNGINTDKIICNKIQELYIENYYSYNILKYLKSDAISFKKTNQYSYMKSKLDVDEELSLLYDNLNILKRQLQINKTSTSHKYIFDQIKHVKKKIDLIDSKSNTNTINDYNLSFLKENFFNQVIIDFDIFSLNFKEKKYLINEILNYISWDNLILKIYIK